MNPQEFERKLSAILSADVVEYSRLMGEDEDLTIHTLTGNRKMMAALINQYKGRVVDSPGDNLLAEFSSVTQAVNCAVEIQRELAERNAELPEDRRMLYRIGVNLGDVAQEGERIYGDGVNIAARLESLAEPGGICISGFVYNQVKNRLKHEYEYLGEQSVKNIKEAVPVYRVLSLPGAAAHRVIKAKKAAEKAQMTSPISDKPSIAVLPFVNMSGDPEQEYFSDGITEDLITDISKISGLFVIARNSTFAYKGQSVDVRQIANDLGVRYVLEGSVRKAAGKVRINAQLVDSTTGSHLWAERYDGSLQWNGSAPDTNSRATWMRMTCSFGGGRKFIVSPKLTIRRPSGISKGPSSWTRTLPPRTPISASLIWLAGNIFGRDMETTWIGRWSSRKRPWLSTMAWEWSIRDWAGSIFSMVNTTRPSQVSSAVWRWIPMMRRLTPISRRHSIIRAILKNRSR
jgi:TolB-like protein